MNGDRRNRRLQPTELHHRTYAQVFPRNRRLTWLERRLGYRSRRGVLTDFALEVFFPGVALFLIFILALLTFFL